MEKTIDLRIINIPKDLHTQFKILCAKEGVSMVEKLKLMMLNEVVKERDKEV